MLLARYSFLRFAVIGALGYAVDCGRAGAVAPHVLELDFEPATAFSICAAMCFTWLGNRYFTFRERRARGFAGHGAGMAEVPGRQCGGRGGQYRRCRCVLVHFAPAALQQQVRRPGLRRAGGAGVQLHPVQQDGVQGRIRDRWLRRWLGRAAAAAVCPRRVRRHHWSASCPITGRPADERGYGEFITAIGESGCRSVDACLKGPANPFRASDPAGAHFESDCADLPYVLRFYYAWKRGLPFSYVSDVTPRGRARDMRYSASGNQVEARRDVLSGDNALAVLARIRDAVSSATYRIHPALEEPENDLYSPAIRPGAIRAGTVIYDPNGHLAII